MPTSFPARLTRFLYARHQQGLHGLLILPCELIENNGDTLKEMVLRHATDWQLDASFVTWLNAECSFRNTLVDRIVSGTDPQDDTLNTSEFFHLWCIEGQPDARLPFAFAGINLKWVQDLSFYRTLKVRILNGAHTAMIPFALLQGVKTVGEAMKSEKVRSHLEGCLAEIISSLGEAYEADATPYAKEVLARFSNPYIQHTCAAISLNSVSKFRVRVLPSVLEYHKQFGIYPKNLLYAFAALIHFYRTGTPRDEADAILKLQTLSLKELLKDVTLWGEDLTPLLPFLEDIICEETVC
jgi:tagaturonate reductase